MAPVDEDTCPPEHVVVAHHEAAHAVLAIELGRGLLEEIGIDIAHFNETGGIGVNGCRFFLADLSAVAEKELEAEQRRLLSQIDCDGTVLAAGPAADAKLRGEDPWTSLQRQRSDLIYMRTLLHKARLDDDPEQATGHLQRQLGLAVEALDDAAVWRAVEAVAAALLERGPLRGADIEAIAEPMLRTPKP